MTVPLLKRTVAHLVVFSESGKSAAHLINVIKRSAWQGDGCLHNSSCVHHHFVLMLEYFPADAGKKNTHCTNQWCIRGNTLFPYTERHLNLYSTQPACFWTVERMCNLPHRTGHSESQCCPTLLSHYKEAIYSLWPSITIRNKSLEISVDRSTMSILAISNLTTGSPPTVPPECIG